MRKRRTFFRFIAGYEKIIVILCIMATIQDKTRALIATKLNLSESEITPEKNFFNDMGADSLDFVELSMILEHEFNVKFTEDDTAKVKTVGDLYELIERYKNKTK